MLEGTTQQLAGRHGGVAAEDDRRDEQLAQARVGVHRRLEQADHDGGTLRVPDQHDGPPVVEIVEVILETLESAAERDLRPSLVAGRVQPLQRHLAVHRRPHVAVTGELGRLGSPVVCLARLHGEVGVLGLLAARGRVHIDTVDLLHPVHPQPRSPRDGRRSSRGVDRADS